VDVFTQVAQLILQSAQVELVLAYWPTGQSTGHVDPPKTKTPVVQVRHAEELIQFPHGDTHARQVGSKVFDIPP
jgi:hypothetical protein